ncbi:MAG: L,D-transpeptidase family protein [Lachnospiraceae bacterium]|nr:L,D-transpeptidase family protein [Lachnospiraceae bacterium]
MNIRRSFAVRTAVFVLVLTILLPVQSAARADVDKIKDDAIAPEIEENEPIEDVALPVDDGKSDLVGTEKEPKPIYLTRTEKTSYVGRTFTLKLKNADGKVRWYSNNEKVATVEDGVVTALSEGTVRIRATCRKIKYDCTVTVKVPQINMTYKRLRNGTTLDLKVKGADIVSWKSSKKKVATVDKDGVVTSKKKGSTTITATDSNGKTYECNVDVYVNILDIENPTFEDLAPTTRMSFEELIGDNGNYTFPVGYPKAGTYKIVVDLYHKVVMAYMKDAKGNYTRPIRYMLCIVGADKTQTPTGTFKMQAFRVRNSIFNNTTSYAQYWSEIHGRIYFHSTLYNSLKAHDYSTASWNSFGSAVSHGCVRLTVPDARWIWYNLAPGTLVEIRRGSSSDTATAEIRRKLKEGLPKLPSTRPTLAMGSIPNTDNWDVADIPNEVKFVQGSQNGGEAAD